MEDRGIFDSGCSGHMTGNKAHLDDFKECKGGSVTFGGSNGYITGKGRIKVGTSEITNHAGTPEVTNSAGTQNTNASEEEEEVEELIIVPTVVQHTAAKVGTRKPSTNSKKEDCNLAQKHLGAALKNNTTSTPSVNTGSGSVNSGKFDASQHADPDDSDMLELEIFNRPKQGIFYEASYDEEGMVHDFNNLPTEVAVSPIPTLRIHNIHPQSQILGNPKSSVQTRSRVKQTSGAYALLGEACKKELLQIIRLQRVSILVESTSRSKDEEVYVSQPPGFVDPDYPNKVYKVVKALYGLHQAPRAWYATLSTFLEEHGYRRDSDYVGANLDRKSTTGSCQFLGSRLISWQCKKQTIVATSTIEAEYVAAASCCGQVLWIQNQMLDYGFNFMNTKIHIDNESIICIVKNPEYHSKTKHIEIRHHFIRDSYEKKLIRYALTYNLTIHDSLVKQFWQTATASTLADGTLELRATIDTLEYTITEASVRSKLQLANASGISMLPNTKIFEERSNIGSPANGQADQAVDQPSPSKPLPSLSHPPVLSATIESEPTPIAEQITHLTSLTPEPDIPQSHDPTHPHVAEERTMTVDDLLQLVPKLITKVDSLETELQQTKLTMGKALVKLVKRVKKMEDVLERRHVVLPDSED
ncbi:putative ribonuclease H-like domain-containing protein [Tanacetum coccineum]